MEEELVRQKRIFEQEIQKINEDKEDDFHRKKKNTKTCCQH